MFLSTYVDVAKVAPRSAVARDENNFGFLRLFFACLVILSHSSELIDGNRSREILTRLFGTLSFGELAVDGFFLISGYLITASFLRTKRWQDYLFNRVLRIYPGFVVAFVLSIFVAGPLGGGHLLSLGISDIVNQITRIFLLQPPNFKGAFENLPYPVLNGSMWTIAYEFRCYLFVLLIGMCGVFKRRGAYLALAAVFVGVWMANANYYLPYRLSDIFGSLKADARFTSLFMIGGGFYLFRSNIVYKAKYALMAAIALLPLMFVPDAAELALAVLGGYLLFWFAFHGRAPSTGGLDLSYGLYLYAYPIQDVFIYYFPHISPWVLFVATLALAGLFGYLSWLLIEGPCLGLKKKRNAQTVPAVAK